MEMYKIGKRVRFSRKCVNGYWGNYCNQVRGLTSLLHYTDYFNWEHVNDRYMVERAGMGNPAD